MQLPADGLTLAHALLGSRQRSFQALHLQQGLAHALGPNTGRLICLRHLGSGAGQLLLQRGIDLCLQACTAAGPRAAQADA